MTSWPVPGYPMSTPYGRKGSMWRACGWHTGIDIAAGTGTPIYSPEAGTVRSRNYGSSFGTQVAVVTGNGSEWFFAHLSALLVGNGQQVGEGQLIGRVGATGNVTGPHLHLELHPRAGSWSCQNMADPMTRLSKPTPEPDPEPDPEEDDMRLWVVNLGPDFGEWLTDFATFRTGINSSLTRSELLTYQVARHYADGRVVQVEVRQQVQKLPEVA